MVGAMVIHSTEEQNNSRDMRPVLLPIVTLFLGGVLLLFSLGIVPTVLFPEETIDLFVHPGNIEVRALYVYKNPWNFPIYQGFCLPLPIDSQHPTPLPVELTLVKTGELVPIRKWFDARTFELHFEPKETVAIELYYRQDTPKQNARYILTTTHAWLQPLSHGAYRLHAEGVMGINSNYPMENRGITEWNWERTNFMPDYDWQIKWSNKGT